MILIAHRGLTHGPDKQLENQPKQIENSLKEKFHCEIDVWFITNSSYQAWFLGHDEPQYQINYEFLNKKGLWIHCKNLEALYELKKNKMKNQYFWHQNDDFTLTSGNYIWTYPGKRLTENSIAVLPEICNLEYQEYVKTSKIYGICTDYVNQLI